LINASHGAFYGSYSAFHRWRYNHLLTAAGGFCHADGNKRYFYINDDRWPGLYALMLMSDSSGHLTPSQCLDVASELKELMPVVKVQQADGHISDVESTTQKFIDACLMAHGLNQKLFINKYEEAPDD
jgi:hypothetical protein